MTATGENDDGQRGDPRRGFDGSDAAVEWTAPTFHGGQVDVEFFETYASGDLAVLVAVERQHGTVGDVPSQDWSLRITLVFRQEGATWHLVHRHADPLRPPVDGRRTALPGRPAVVDEDA